MTGHILPPRRTCTRELFPPPRAPPPWRFYREGPILTPSRTQVHTLIASGIQRRATGRRVLLAAASSLQPSTKKQRRNTSLEAEGNVAGSTAQPVEPEFAQASELADLDDALGTTEAIDLDGSS